MGIDLYGWIGWRGQMKSFLGASGWKGLRRNRTIVAQGLLVSSLSIPPISTSTPRCKSRRRTKDSLPPPHLRAGTEGQQSGSEDPAHTHHDRVPHIYHFWHCVKSIGGFDTSRPFFRAQQALHMDSRSTWQIRQGEWLDFEKSWELSRTKCSVVVFRKRVNI